MESRRPPTTKRNEGANGAHIISPCNHDHGHYAVGTSKVNDCSVRVRTTVVVQQLHLLIDERGDVAPSTVKTSNRKIHRWGERAWSAFLKRSLSIVVVVCPFSAHQPPPTHSRTSICMRLTRNSRRSDCHLYTNNTQTLNERSVDRSTALDHTYVHTKYIHVIKYAAAPSHRHRHEWCCSEGIRENWKTNCSRLRTPLRPVQYTESRGSTSIP